MFRYGYPMRAGLLDLGASRVRLMTSGPERSARAAAGIVVEDRVLLWRPSKVHNGTHLEVKRDRMGHFPTDGSAGAGATRETA